MKYILSEIEEIEENIAYHRSQVSLTMYRIDKLEIELEDAKRALEIRENEDEKMSKVYDIIKESYLTECECYSQRRCVCIEDESLLEAARKIVKLFEFDNSNNLDNSNNKEILKSILLTAKLFLDRSLTEIQK
jgi:hypothetical protein